MNRRDSTKARDESYLRSLVLPVFADMPIGAINVFDVQEWVSDLDADGYAPATIRKAYQLLGRICNDAVNGGLIAQSAHPAVIASRLGHTSVKTVLDVYGHLYEGLDRNGAMGDGVCVLGGHGVCTHDDCYFAVGNPESFYLYTTFDGFITPTITPPKTAE